MSSAGHILDMINRIKQNKTLRKRKKFKENNRENSFSEKSATPTEYDFPTVSETEMVRIKVQIRGTAETNDRRSLYVLAIVLVLVAIAFWFFIQNYAIGAFRTYGPSARHLLSTARYSLNISI